MMPAPVAGIDRVPRSGESAATIRFHSTEKSSADWGRANTLRSSTKGAGLAYGCQEGPTAGTRSLSSGRPKAGPVGFAHATDRFSRDLPGLLHLLRDTNAVLPARRLSQTQSCRPYTGRYPLEIAGPGRL